MMFRGFGGPGGHRGPGGPFGGPGFLGGLRPPHHHINVGGVIGSFLFLIMLVAIIVTASS